MMCCVAESDRVRAGAAMRLEPVLWVEDSLVVL